MQAPGATLIDASTDRIVSGSRPLWARPTIPAVPSTPKGPYPRLSRFTGRNRRVHPQPIHDPSRKCLPRNRYAIALPGQPLRDGASAKYRVASEGWVPVIGCGYPSSAGWSPIADPAVGRRATCRVLRRPGVGAHPGRVSGFSRPDVGHRTTSPWESKSVRESKRPEKPFPFPIPPV